MLNDLTMSRPELRRVMREERGKRTRRARLERIKVKRAFLDSI